MTDLGKLGEVLAEARRERETELSRLSEMSEEEVAYLASVGELDDSLSDGLECA